MIAEGQPAPDFTLLDQDGQAVTLSAQRGSPVVLYFYPKDDTPGCTTEACAFRDADADYQAAGAKILGVSPDSVKSHAKFAAKFQLNFPILADTETAVCQLFGVWKEKSMYGKTYMGVERTTVLIDGDGVVRKIFPKVKVPGHSEAILEALKAMG
ncbi:thioredoxin-dependent thiol peroxidase [Tundrisphaera lichenicola]|uniref:thioredoxin-dependent thiol peroxidase n=1 Tax=Tundrisphaera lichenicola TaxID=2029860 RepID=UPI003EB99743